MSLAVVLLNWHHAAETLQTVRHLSGFAQPPNIWIVDNASGAAEQVQLQELAMEMQSKGTPVHLHFNQNNLGYAGGCNVGIAAALAGGYSAILLMNVDAHITETNLQALYNHLTSHPQTAVCGPALREEHNGQVNWSVGGQFPHLSLDTRLWQKELASQAETRTVAYVPGTVALFRADALRQVGLLDERYFFSVEIADWCWRAEQAGWLCQVLPHIPATHATEQKSTQRNSLYLYYSLRNRLYFCSKFGLQGAFWRWSMVYLWLAVKAIGRGNRPRARAIFHALQKGWQG
ncbi:MAG TPA: glycosyltransferase family 2 protein [Anaerolineales bacterium]|nr:glycosyltransferase family 2 protein [Anaerolineales bacterium]